MVRGGLANAMQAEGYDIKEQTDSSRQDYRLVRLCQNGDHGSFKILFEKYQRRTYATAYNILGEHDAAQDAVQEAFVRAYRNIRGFNANKNFYTWLYQILVNLCIDILRKRKSRKVKSLAGLPQLLENDDLLQPPANTLGREELRERINRLLTRLPDKYRLVLSLRDIEGLTCEEIASTVSCKNTTVRWRIHKARKLFKELWYSESVNISEYLEDDQDGL